MIAEKEAFCFLILLVEGNVRARTALIRFEVIEMRLSPEDGGTGVFADRAVVAVDMVGYSGVARLLEENGGPAMVAHLNRQIQQFIAAGLSALDDSQGYAQIAQTGDGVICMFESCVDAHRFARAIHAETELHNKARNEASARRCFRIGIAVGDITADPDLANFTGFAGITIANAVRLETAGQEGQTVIEASVWDKLPEDLRADYGLEENIRGKRDEVFRARRSRSTRVLAEKTRETPAHLTRRKAIGLGLVALAGSAAWLEWSRWSMLFERLPQKRFVALLNWPLPVDLALAPLMAGLVDAIGNELIRAEAYDHDLLVIPHTASEQLDSAAEFRKMRDELGTNLVLAVYGKEQASNLHVSMKVTDASSAKTLRERHYVWPVEEQISFPERATRAAASLLGVSKNVHDDQPKGPETHSAAAYRAFEAGEAYLKQENDTGLTQAIDKFKEAAELDSGFAAPHAQLGRAYFRYYVLKGDSGALALARGNCETALSLDPNSWSAHLALSSVLENTGDESGAAQEIAKAASIDPRNPRTMVYQGQLFARLNQWADAERAFKRSVAARPNYWLPRNELGVLYYSQGKYGQALLEFKAAALTAPGNSLPLVNIASVNAYLGQFAEAKIQVDRALALNASDGANKTLASLLRVQGRAGEATRFALEATRLGASDALNWVELGDCYEQITGHTRDALSAYAQGTSAQKEELQTDLRNGPGWIVLAVCQAKSGARAEALESLQQASTYPSGDMDSRLAKARALAVLGQRDEAAKLIAECKKDGATPYQIASISDLTSIDAPVSFHTSPGAQS